MLQVVIPQQPREVVSSLKYQTGSRQNTTGLLIFKMTVIGWRQSMNKNLSIQEKRNNYVKFNCKDIHMGMYVTMLSIILHMHIYT